MKIRPIKVVVKNGIGIEPADLIICPDCDHAAFLIYYLQRDPGHPHLQCARCDKTFCGQAGVCAVGAENERPMVGRAYTRGPETYATFEEACYVSRNLDPQGRVVETADGRFKVVPDED